MDILEATDDARIMELLGRDPAWAGYAITDLEPPYRQYARFLGAVENGALLSLVVLYAAPGFRSLLPFGDGAGLRAILQQASGLPDETFVITGGEHRAILEERYDLDVWPMLRMVLRPENLRAPKPVHIEIRRLTMADLDELRELYAYWRDPIFTSMMLEHGTYFAAAVDGSLVAVAGTHTQSPTHRLGTVGGVFTRPEYRGRGLAMATTHAVAEALIKEGTELVVLNVRANNEPAIAAYRRIGFTVHMPFWEGTAVRKVKG